MKNNLIPYYQLPGADVDCKAYKNTIKRLRKLARELTFKADIYCPRGRIYSHEGKWTVAGGRLFHGFTEINPDLLTDGNGQAICW